MCVTSDLPKYVVLKLEFSSDLVVLLFLVGYPHITSKYLYIVFVE